jgi:tetratricopeptide (TPR) repeat protein
MVRVGVLRRRAGWLELEGSREEEGTVLQEAIRLAEAEGETSIALEVRQQLGYQRRAIGSPDEAVEILTEAAEIARKLGEHSRESAVNAALAAVHADQGRYDEARESYQSHLQRVREFGTEKDEAGVLGNLATVEWETGRYEDSLANFNASLELFRRIGGRRGEGSILGNMGLDLDSLGRFDEARECFEKHRDISREIGYRRGEAMALGNLGQACASLGLFAEALDCFEGDLEIGAELNNPMHVGITQMGVGGLWVDLGQYDRAKEALNRAGETFAQLGYRWGRSYVLELLACVAEEEARPDEVEELLLESKDQRKELGLDDGVAESLCMLGRFHARRGEIDQARSELEECIALLGVESGPGTRSRAIAHLATLPGADVDAARRTVRADSGQLSITDRIDAHFALYRASGEEEELAEARRLLDFLVANAPEQYRDSIRANVSLHREIEAALA